LHYHIETFHSCGLSYDSALTARHRFAYFTRVVAGGFILANTWDITIVDGLSVIKYPLWLNIGVRMVACGSALGGWASEYYIVGISV
jgi:hypothetical protein